jgi:hypothetical protein
MDNVRVNGYRGTWYSVDKQKYFGQTLYLMESEQWGDMAEYLIIDKDKNVILDEVFNGWDDLDYAIESENILYEKGELKYVEM